MINEALLHQVTFKVPQKGGCMEVNCHHISIGSVFINKKEYPIIELHFTKGVVWEINPLDIEHVYPVIIK